MAYTVLLIALVAPVAAAPENGRQPAVDARLRLLRDANLFEGATIGFGGVTSRTRKAFEALLVEGAAEPFLELAAAPSPAARVWGIEGLATLLARADALPDARAEGVRALRALLDDERRVELIMSCEHISSAVAAEAFKALGRLLTAKELDALAAEIFRAGVAQRDMPVKLRLALKRALRRPTAASLGFLFHQFHDATVGAALLDPRPLDDATLRPQRLAAVRAALVSEFADLRLGGLGAARELGAGEFIESIIALTGDDDGAVAALALRVLGDLATAGRADAVAAAVDAARAALAGPRERRAVASDVLVRLAAPWRRAPGHRAPPAGLLDALTLAVATAPANGVAVAEALAAIDGDGARSLRLVQGDFSDLDPRAFAPLAAAAAAAPRSRDALRARLLELAGDTAARWKMRLYAVRALGELHETRAVAALASLRDGADARLAREARRALDRIAGATP